MAFSLQNVQKSYKVKNPYLIYMLSIFWLIENSFFFIFHCFFVSPTARPTKQYFDASELTTSAARKLNEYVIGSKSLGLNIDDLQQKANSIAIEALQTDDMLLAVAIAAPTHKVAVVQFREFIENPREGGFNQSHLSTYWRELGDAWNHSDGDQFWGAPFRDCGALTGRWLWPFSVNINENGLKYVPFLHCFFFLSFYFFLCCYF